MLAFAPDDEAAPPAGSGGSRRSIRPIAASSRELTSCSPELEDLADSFPGAAVRAGDRLCDGRRARARLRAHLCRGAAARGRRRAGPRLVAAQAAGAGLHRAAAALPERPGIRAAHLQPDPARCAPAADPGSPASAMPTRPAAEPTRCGLRASRTWRSARGRVHVHGRLGLVQRAPGPAWAIACCAGPGPRR